MKEYVLAILTDLHLPDRNDTVKEEVLEWAVAELGKRKIREIVSLGDMTAVGTLPAALRFRKRVSSLARGRFYYTCGNAELRSPAETAGVLQALQSPAETPHALLLDSSTGAFSSSARTLLTKALLREDAKSFLILTHFPPAELPEEDRGLLALGGKLGRIEGIIHGHRHRDRHYRWNKTPSFEVRGMDPDKSIGGPPCVALFSRDGNGKWRRKNLVYTKADPNSWPEAERKELLASLGLSGMAIPLETFAFATEKKVPVYEWRYTALTEEEKKVFLTALSRWREEGGGKCFSIHLPDCKWVDGELTGLPQLRDAVALTLLFKAERVTLHVPRLSITEFSDPQRASAITDPIAEILRPMVAEGVVIGVENLHMRHGEKADEKRGYGYTPEEVLQYVEMLRARGIPCGVHLDWGHVKNNAPYASFHTVSDWLAICGKEINGCHIHQVVREKDGLLHNHKALTELYGKFISLGSLFLAWKNSEIPHPPLILEIRHEMGPYSLEKLRRALGEK